MREPQADPGKRERLERAASALRIWLDRIRGVPTILSMVLWASVAAGLVTAWLWFVSSELVLVRWLAIPWLALVAAPQLGMWILLTSIRELFALPERLLAVKSEITQNGSRALERIRRQESEAPKRGFLGTLRDAYSLHGEIGKVVATRAILHRFTGSIAILIGPASFIANCLLIVAALVSIALS